VDTRGIIFEDAELQTNRTYLSPDCRRQRLEFAVVGFGKDMHRSGLLIELAPTKKDKNKRDRKKRTREIEEMRRSIGN
jgi:hypothetical protein